MPTDEMLAREWLREYVSDDVFLDEQDLTVLLARARLDEAKWFMKVFNEGMTADRIGKTFDARVAALEAAAKEGE